MGYITVESIERGTNQTGGGDIKPGLRVLGTADGFNNGPDRPYDKFIYDHPSNTEIQELFEQYSNGDRLNVVNEKDGDFWNIINVLPLAGTTGKARPTDKSAAADTAAPAAAKQYVSGKFREPEEIIRGEALASATKFVASLVTAKIIPAKTKVEQLTGLLYNTAEDFVAFAKDTLFDKDSKSDAVEPASKPLDGEDEDIPF